jgi:hypothetical protein
MPGPRYAGSKGWLGGRGGVGLEERGSGKGWRSHRYVEGSM